MKLDMLAFTGVFGEEHEALNKSSFCRFVLFRIGSGQIRLNIDHNSENHYILKAPDKLLWILGNELIKFSRDTSTWVRMRDVSKKTFQGQIFTFLKLLLPSLE